MIPIAISISFYFQWTHNTHFITTVWRYYFYWIVIEDIFELKTAFYIDIVWYILRAVTILLQAQL